MLKIRNLLVILITIIDTQIVSIDIQYEDTWSKRTLYKEGCTFHENILYVNSYLSIEYYSIQDNGNLEYEGHFEDNGVVRKTQVDESDELLYVYYSSYTDTGSDWITAYNVSEGNPEFCFSSNDFTPAFPYKDIVYTVSDYVIFFQPDITPCYNKLTGEFETITYPYIEVVGAYNNILIDYDTNSSILNFYQIENINQPILLYQYNYSIDEPFRTLTRCFDEIHCLVVDKNQVLVFNLEDEQNITYETTWQFNFTINNQILKEPIEFDNDLIYFGTAFGDNFIYDVSNYNNPVLINSWYEEDYDAFSYCIYNANWLYRTMDKQGIWKYNLSNMPTNQHDEYGYAFPLCSTEYFNGIIYKNDYDNLYKLDTNSLEEEIICEIPFSIGWNYYLHENMLLIEAGNLISYNLAIVDLEQNQIMNYINPGMSLQIAQNGRLFYQLGNNVEVYQVDQNFELEFLVSIETGANTYLSEYDNDRIWVSCFDHNFLFNSSTLQIDHDFGDYFSSFPGVLINPVKYDNRLIVSDFTNETRLYDISNLNYPVLLDSKTGEHLFNFSVLDDFIIETYLSESSKIYNKFDNTFTDPIQEYDFETIVFDLKIDEVRNRILTSSWYFFKSYLYDITGNGINIVPEVQSDRLSNYPNPFNPSTTISFSIEQHEQNQQVELSIFNIKGQKVKTLMDCRTAPGKYNCVWNGRNEAGKRVSSGQYTARLTINGEEKAVRKIMLVK